MTIILDSRSLEAIALHAIVSGLEAVEQRSRQLEAERVRLLAEAFDLAAYDSGGEQGSVPSGASGELAHRAIRAEIATALHVSERTVDRHLAHAHQLAVRFPAVHDALAGGEISSHHAHVIVEAGQIIGAGVDPDAVGRRSNYAETVLEGASIMTPADLAARAKRVAERYAETSLDQRHATARRQRRVWVQSRENGMADLVAHLPAAEAYAIKDRLTRVAVQIAEFEQAAQAPSGRCRDEIRVDALSELLLRGGVDEAADGSAVSGIAAVVQVVAPSEMLEIEPARLPDGQLGDPLWGEAAHLEGYGPIDTATARRLAGEASHWEMIHENPAGEVLSVDRYRPSEQMRRLLRARDQHCCFPGCRVPAVRCDLDHTVDAARGGPTSTENLAYLCRGHHTLKHHTGWSVRQTGGGSLRWQSPTGRVHETRPPNRTSGVRFEPVLEPAPF